LNIGLRVGVGVLFGRRGIFQSRPFFVEACHWGPWQRWDSVEQVDASRQENDGPGGQVHNDWAIIGFLGRPNWDQDVPKLKPKLGLGWVTKWVFDFRPAQNQPRTQQVPGLCWVDPTYWHPYSVAPYGAEGKSSNGVRGEWFEQSHV
jgi:hypothetical protein